MMYVPSLFFFISVCEVQEIAATCLFRSIFSGMMLFCSFSKLLPNVVNSWTFEDKFESASTKHLGMAAMYLSDTKEWFGLYPIVQAVMLVIEDLREWCQDLPRNTVSHSFSCHDVCVNTYQNGEFSALSELKMNYATVLHILFFFFLYKQLCGFALYVLYYK